MIWNEYTPDYVAIIATEAAVMSMRADAPAPPKPPLPDCKECRGTGQIRTGDGQGWTACPCTERAESRSE